MEIDNKDNNDDENNSTFDTIIKCNELIVEMLQYTYDEINSKRYLIERKPYQTGNSFAIFEHDLQLNDNRDFMQVENVLGFGLSFHLRLVYVQYR
jgi:hypothetical protein